LLVGCSHQQRCTLQINNGVNHPSYCGAPEVMEDGSVHACCVASCSPDMAEVFNPLSSITARCAGERVAMKITVTRNQ